MNIIEPSPLIQDIFTGIVKDEFDKRLYLVAAQKGLLFRILYLFEILRVLQMKSIEEMVTRLSFKHYCASWTRTKVKAGLK